MNHFGWVAVTLLRLGLSDEPGTGTSIPAAKAALMVVNWTQMHDCDGDVERVPALLEQVRAPASPRRATTVPQHPLVNGKSEAGLWRERVGRSRNDYGCKGLSTGSTTAHSNRLRG